MSSDQARRKALLALLLEQEGLAARGSAIPRRTTAGPVPLSHAQRRLWLLEQTRGEGAPAYNMPAAYLLRGPVDVAALEAAFGALLARHEILRTRFVVAADGEPLQEVVADARVTIERTEADSPDAFRALAADVAGRAFDLAVAPLLRVALVSLDDTQHGLVMVLHHVVADGWSLPLLLQELSELYAAAHAGRSPALAPLELHYADYTLWHREALASEAMAPHRAFWLEQFRDPPPVLALPADHPRPPVQRFLGDAVTLAIPDDVAARLDDLARSRGTSLFMTLLAALQVLLHRYSGQDDVTVGTPVAGRVHPALQRQIGFYVNMLPLRVHIDPREPFTGLLDRVRRLTGEALEHEQYPFDELVHERGLARDRSRSPVFDVVLVVDARGEPLALADLAVSEVPLPRRTSKFDLTVHFTEQRPGLDVLIEYNTGLFRRDRVERMGRHLQTLLAALVAAPETPVGRLPLLDAEERRRVLGSALPAPAPARTVVAMFEEQARRAPRAPAVCFDGDTLDYGALETRANQLAHHLRAAGVGPEVRVGLCLERSVDLVVAILAVLKAGGAYVPVDPSYPAERIAYLLEDSAAAVVVGGAVAFDGPRIDLRTDADAIAARPQARPDVALHHDQAAYVIYTSGSTGKPKGCVVTHGNVARLMTSTEDWFGFGPDDVWTLFHSCSFDFSVWEIWGALAYGGRLVVVPYWVSRNPEAFLELLSREHVTVLNQTPSAFRQLAAADADAERALALREVIFGGEALEIASLDGWFRRHGDRRPRLVNMYGITETTVHVTWRPVQHDDVRRRAGSVIGQPIQDLQLYLLDASSEPVPVGIVGEMYVGGAGLARGYLGRPDLTAERFVPDPFGAPGGRLYRTGDLARFTAEGDVEYLGRADQQVKVRGFRIEVGEIEAALRAVAGVRDVAVIDRKAGDVVQLVAYVVGSGDASSWRAALEASLPEHMVPARFVGLAVLPLTPHGKLDRAALPAPEEVVAEDFEPPRGELETTIARVWAEILGLPRVGRDQGYFDLGGDSILALRLVSALRGAGVETSLRELYLARTVAELASRQETARPSAEVKPALAAGAVPEGAVDAYPAARLQAGMLYHSERDPEKALFHDIFTYRLRFGFDEALFTQAVAVTVARHAALRTSFRSDLGDEPMQVVQAHVVVPVRVIDLRGRIDPEALLADWVEAERADPFALDRAPLVRVVVHLLPADVVHVGVSIHHAIVDGWSFATWIAELFTVYQDLVAGLPVSDLPSDTDARVMREFVALEHAALASAESRAFWAARVERAPLARVPRSSGGGAGLAVREIAIPPDVRAGLERLASRTGVPLRTVCLAGHLRVLSLVSGERDVVTGLTTSGRPETAEASAAVGLFLNTLPFRLRLRRESGEQLVRRTFAAEQDALPHRRFPISEIRRLAGGRELYDAGFNFVHFHVYRPLVDQGAVEVLAVEVHERTDYAFVASLAVDPRDGSLSARLMVERSEIGSDLVERLADLYTAVYAELARFPDRVGTVGSLLAPDDARGIIDASRGEDRPLPGPGGLLVARFLAQAAAHPSAIAVRGAGEPLTYAALDEASASFARRLSALGVGAESRVALSMDRAPRLLVAILGIARAGGVWVPVDPETPRERLPQLLADSGAVALVTDARGRQAYAGLGVDLVDVDEEGPSSALPLPSVAPDQLAYVIYTSGSTGVPKGVAVAHRGLAQYLDWAAETYRVADGDGSVVHSSVSFDATLTSLLTPLLVGRTVTLLDEEQPVQALAAVLRAPGRPGLVKITPAHLGLLAHELGEDGLKADVGVFVIGGEALHGDILAPWRRLTRARLVNEYGPTETVVGCAVFEDAGGDGPVPIGRPIARAATYVLDETLEPVPPGTVGEIVIGGAGVARGYLGRPDATAERFVPDPWSVTPGARMYRSGDRGRWNVSGQLEYLGRADFQVKVRGHRVELGEIEAALRAAPGVTDAAVLAPEVGGTHELVAYVAGGEMALEPLREFLRARLPAALVPSRFVTLPALPLTTNGKVDRAALAGLEAMALAPTAAPVAPRTEAERKLASIWADVLQAPSLGVHDDWFARGGDSLKALQVVARARAAGLSLRLRDLFDAPTVAELALRSAPTSAPVAPATAVGRFPLTAIQRWFFEEHRPPHDHFNWAVLLRAADVIDVDALRRALDVLREHHDLLRARFDRVHGTVPAEAPALDVSVVDLRGRPDAAAALEATADELHRSFDLAAGRLMAVAVFRLDDGDRLLLVVHHLVVDGVSWRVLLEDLDGATRGLALPAKTVSFKAWADALAAYAVDPSLLAQRDYWDRVCRRMPTAPLPPTRPGVRHTVRLTPELTTELLGVSHRAYGTQANDLLLAALAPTLQPVLGGTRHVVMLEGHGREGVLDGLDASRTVGWFTTRYPVLLEAQASWRDQVRGVKETLRAVPDRGFGYGVLRYLTPPAHTSGWRLDGVPRVAFNYLGRFDREAGSSFTLATEGTGQAVPPDMPPDHDVDVVAVVLDGRLELRLTVSSRLPEATGPALAEAWARALAEVVAHCRDRPREPTPSDLTWTNLDLPGFDALLAAHGLTAADVEDVAPLSPMQEGLLFHALRDGSRAYFEQSAYRLEGDIDPARFAVAWEGVLDRHPNLRVAVWHRDVPQPVQVMRRGVRLPFLYEDLSALDAVAQDEHVRRFRDDDRARGFDVETDPLLRVALFRRGPGAHEAVWSFHHLLLDGWSAGIVLGELLEIHAGLVEQRTPALPEVVPYRRYLQWLERRDVAASARFWAELLAGYEETASLPGETSPGAAYRAVSRTFRLDAAESRRLEQLAVRLRVTLSTLVETLWGVLVGRYDDRRDVVFGATVSGRPDDLPGTERLVGLFINTVPVRVRWDAETTFAELAQRVQAQVLQSQPHLVAPLAEIQAGTPLRSVLFDHILVFENYPLDERLRTLGRGQGPRVVSSDVFEQVHYDLALLVAPGRDGIDLRLIGNAARYPDERLASFLRHFRTLADAVATDATRPVRDYGVVAPAEVLLLESFNPPSVPSTGATLVSLFEAQVRRAPDAVAVVDGTTRLTYAEIDRRSAAVARGLVARGVGAEVRVGVCLPRHADLVVALLGVMRAGGAYVPLDAAYPAERIAYLVSDAAMAFVLGDPRELTGLIAPEHLVTLAEVETAGHAGVLPRVDAAQLAYVIYTSGSTGRPKGVMITHDSAAALVEWTATAYTQAELARVLAATSVCFDLSVFEIFATLGLGGTVVLADNALALPTLPARDEVTLVNTVPSAVAELLRQDALPASVRTVNLAGEPLLATLADAVYATGNVQRVVDLYGPSEDTTYSTVAVRAPGGPATIGVPLPGTRMHIVDAALQPLPVGVVGELVISGRGLARGYLGQPALTAERFVPDPWSVGERLYRTGDLARYRADGNIEFLGRRDHQVKIRGFRIELGEVQTALARVSGVVDAAVVARVDAGDLVAYVVGPEVDPAACRAALERTLPPYMVPSSFVVLEQLPRTPNGKLDRAALPAPGTRPLAGGVAPRSATEAVLVEAWADVLGVPPPGIFDSFFDLGGHSLKATRLVARLRQEHGFDITLRDLFAFPTIAGLAEVAESRRPASAGHIPPAAPAADYPVSAAQRRLFVLEQMRPDGPAAYNIPAAFLLEGEVDRAALENAFRTVMQRHEPLRTRFFLRDGEPRQQIVDDPPFALLGGDLAEADLALEGRRLAIEPFDLGVAPLLRAALYRLGPERHALVLVLHHVVADGWSLPLFARDLATAYGGGTLPPLRTHSKDFAVWQAGSLAAPGGDGDYWREVFATPPPALDLLTDAPRPRSRSYRGGQVSRRLRIAREDVQQRAAAARTSLFGVLLAGVTALLHRVTGQDDLTLGSPVAGRVHPDLHEQVGCHVNTVALRQRVDRRQSFDTLLAGTRDVLRGALEHQAYPFDRLVDELDLPRDPARSPLFDVMVAMENNERAEPVLGALRLTPLPLAYDISKFDLTFAFVDGPEGLEANLEFDSDLFLPETAERLLRRLETLLAAALEAPGTSLADLPLLDRDEAAHVVTLGLGPSRPLPAATLADRFEEQARLFPRAPALVAGSHRLTYEELDRQAAAVAAELRRRGVAAEERVGLAGRPGAELVIGLLGILKAGAAYVPLDAAGPRDRLDRVLADASVRVVVGRPEKDPGRPTIDPLDPGAGTGAPLPPRALGDLQLAYVMYTSGSTGVPKGVACTHRGVVALLDDMERRAPLPPGASGALWTSAAFDVSVYEIFSALLYGRCLHVVPDEVRADAPAHFAFLRDHHVASAYVPPFQVADLLAFATHTPLALRRLLVGVEPIDEALLASVAARIPGLRIVNGYGPTETAICATLHDVLPDAPSRRTPIGQPVQNGRVYLLDEDRRRVGIGMAGDLYVAGHGLARGYLANATGTAEAFLPDPFSALPGERMYRTGDRARWLPEGSLEFLGRADHQVKVRGHRIELGEVEAALRACPLLADAAVLAPVDGATRTLVAWLVPRDPTVTVEAVREFLETRLPEVMIPTRFATLAALPQTATGKVDRAALARSDAAALPFARAHAEPRTAVEMALCGLFAEVLGLPGVGIHDNYFGLGGDSIKAIQLAARAPSRGFKLTVRQVFENPTVAALAPHVVAAVPVAEEVAIAGPVPLTAIQEWFFRENVAPYDRFNQALLLRFKVAVDVAALEAALDRLVAHHDALRLRFTREGKGWHQEVAPSAAAVSCRLLDLRDRPRPDAEAALAAEMERLHAALDLAQGRVLAVAVVRLADGDRLALVLHHLVTDGVSWRILLEDLQAAYGSPEPLPPRTASWARWAREVRAFAAGGGVDDERPYWQAVAQAPVPPLPLGPPADGPRHRAARRLDAPLSAALLGGAHAAYAAETHELLLAGLARALGDWHGGARTLVALEGHGREPVVDVDVSRTVGWFTSLYPFVLESVATSDAEQVSAVRDGLRAVPRRGIGYGLLREVAGVDELAVEPAIRFNYLGQFDREIETSLFGPADEPTGEALPAAWNARQPLEVTAVAVGGRMELSLTTPAGRLPHEDAERLLVSWADHLERLARPVPVAAVRLTLVEPSAAEREDAIAAVGAAPRDVEDVHPLSALQEGMLFDALYDRGSAAYFEQIAYRIRGHVDPAAFARAFDQLAARHGVLRTAIAHERVARPLAVVWRRRAVDFTTLDWSALTAAEQASKLQRLQQEDRRRGFDLARDPLMRVVLVATGPGSWALVWSHPHLLLDGWSRAVLLQELVALYASVRAGAPLALPVAEPFRSYLRLLKQRDARADVAYWTTTLAGVDEPTTIASTSPEPGDGYRRGESRFTLGADVVGGVQALCARLGVTAGVVVQALWAVVLGRLDGRDDVVFGMTVSGRPPEMPGLERMVGLFINTVPVRVRLRAGESFATLLQRVQHEALAAAPHTLVPLPDILAQTPLRAGLFDHILAVENYPVDPADDTTRDWSVEAVEVFEQVPYPLAVAVATDTAGWRVRLTYDQRVFDGAAVARLQSLLDTSLRDLLARPEAPLAATDGLDPAVRHDLVSRGQAPAATGTTLWQRLQEQARLTPDRVAVVAGATSLTFGELHQRADALAARLTAQGARVDVPVALALPRSAELVVGMLAILKSGAPYLPLDPALPAARLGQLMTDAGATLVVTRAGLLGADAAPGVTRVDVDDPGAPPRAGAEPHPLSLAYVLHTSGSTGTPKAVAIPHGALSNHMEWMRAAFPLAADDRVLQKTAVGFDASVWEFWAPLAEGATLVMASEGAPRDPATLVAELQRSRITVLQVVPTLLDALLDEPGLAGCHDLRRVFVGGEALTRALVERFARALPGVVLVNLYGPSETTVDATSWTCRPGVPVALGEPIHGARALVLDAALRVSPVGAWGELYLGGDGLGRGYKGRPDLTAEAWVPDPFGPAGGRLYRTGDRVMRTAAGDLVYGGRRDRQVKLRGFRIEPAEVEAALRTHPAVAAAAVAVRGTAAQQRLVAWIVVRGGGSLPVDALRTYLGERLPAHMVPTQVALLDALPLLASGKVDRARLPEPGVPEASFRAPATPQEETLAAVFAEVLGLAQVGADDDFFALGGHSLAATRVASRASRAFSLSVTVRDVFEFPVVAALARHVTALQWSAGPPAEAAGDDYEEMVL